MTPRDYALDGISIDDPDLDSELQELALRRPKGPTTMKRTITLLALLVALCARPAAAQQTLSGTTCPGDGCAQTKTEGRGSVAIQITGTFSGTLQFEQSVDGTNYVSISVTPYNSSTTVTSTTAAGFWTANLAGVKYLRVRASALSSGSPVVSYSTTSASMGGGGGGATVTDATITVTDVTTNNATSSAHGWLPKLSGNAYDFFLGDGSYGRTVARGTITTSSPWTFTQTWNAVGTTFNGFKIAITDTASATASELFQVYTGAAGTTCAFAVEKSAASTCYLSVKTNTGEVHTQDFHVISGQITIPDTSYVQTGTRAYWHTPTTREFAIGSNGSSGKEYTIVAGSVPTCSSGCGTGPTLSATNSVGRITLGSSPSATTVVLNFTETMPTAPACTATNETQGALMVATASTTQLTLTGTSLVQSNAISWHCISWQ